MNKNNFNAIDIANYIVLRAREMGIDDITHLKLQKLLYYVLARYFKNERKRLVDEDICKWQYGPVVKSVYHQFKLNGNNNIIKPSVYLDPSSTYLEGSEEFFIKFVDVDSINKEIGKRKDIKSAVDFVLQKIGTFKPFTLVDRTHDEYAWKSNERDILLSRDGLYYSDAELLDANI